MVRLWLGFVLSFSALALTSPPAASLSLKNVSGETFYLDLDTEYGALSEWRQAEINSFSALRARMWVTRINVDSRWPQVFNTQQWTPLFAFWLQLNESRSDAIGLELKAVRGHMPLSAWLVRYANGKKIEEYKFTHTVELNERVQLNITWAKRGSARIAFRGESKIISLPWSIQSLAITCSTGQLKVDPLLLLKAGTAAQNTTES